MPASSAAASAPSRILTKNGLVSVFVIRQAEVEWASAKAAPDRAMVAAVVASRVFMMFLPRTCRRRPAIWRAATRTAAAPPPCQRRVGSVN